MMRNAALVSLISNYSMTRYISHSYGKIILVGIWTCANVEELYVD